MSKTKTPTIKSTSVPSAYDTPMTSLEYLRKVEEQNAQVLARQDEIEEALADKVNKSGDTMTGALNTPQANADTGVFRHLNAVSQDGNTHVEVSNGGFIAEVTEETTGNKKYGVIAYPNGKVGFYAHDSAHNKDVNFIVPNMDDYEAGTYELATKDDIPSGGLEIERVTLTNSTQSYNATINIDIVNDYFAVIDFKLTNRTALSSGLTFDFTMTAEQKAILINVLANNRNFLTEYTDRISSTDTDLINGCDITLISYLNYLRVNLHGELPANGVCEIHEVFSK